LRTSAAEATELGCQLLHGGEQELFPGAEVVLDQPAGHPGFGCDLAHLGGRAARAAAVGSSASAICRRRSS
jgi:hypothetical protein